MINIKYYSELIITFKIKMTDLTDVTGSYIPFFIIILFLTNMKTLHHPTPYTGIRGRGNVQIKLAFSCY